MKELVDLLSEPKRNDELRSKEDTQVIDELASVHPTEDEDAISQLVVEAVDQELILDDLHQASSLVSPPAAADPHAHRMDLSGVKVRVGVGAFAKRFGGLVFKVMSPLVPTDEQKSEILREAPELITNFKTATTEELAQVVLSVDEKGILEYVAKTFDNLDAKTVFLLVKKYPDSLKYLQRAFLETHLEATLCLKDPTSNVQMNRAVKKIAIRKSPTSLFYLDDISEEYIREAVEALKKQKERRSFRFYKTLYSKGLGLNEDLLEFLIDSNPTTFRLMRNPSLRLKKYLIKNHPQYYVHILDISPDLIVYLLKHAQELGRKNLSATGLKRHISQLSQDQLGEVLDYNPLSLKVVFSPPKDVVIRLLKEDGSRIEDLIHSGVFPVEYIKAAQATYPKALTFHNVFTPSEQEQLLVVKQDPSLVLQLLHPNRNVCALALEEDGMLLRKLKGFYDWSGEVSAHVEPRFFPLDDELLETAVRSNWRAISFISKPSLKLQIIALRENLDAYHLLSYEAGDMPAAILRIFQEKLAR